MQDNNNLEDSVNMDYNANNNTDGSNSFNSPISPISVIINQHDDIPNQIEEKSELEQNQETEQNDENQDQENSDENYADNEQEENYDIYYSPLNMVSNIININPNTATEINERVNI